MELEEAKTAMSLITTEAHKLSGGHRITGDAWARAIQKVVDTQYPGKTPLELRREMSLSFGKMSGAGRPKKTKSSGGIEVMESQLDRTIDKKKTFEDMFREWIDENDVIPPDSLFAHFGVCASNTVSRLRSDLKNEGWEFELVAWNKGWTVKTRPVKTKTTEELAAEFAEAVRTGASVRAAALVMELMQHLIPNTNGNGKAK